MRKEDILREELARMRKLMGISGQLYQKPLMEQDEGEKGGDELYGPGTKRPDEAAFRKQYGKGYAERFNAAMKTWLANNPPAPAPKPKAPKSPSPAPSSPSPSPSPSSSPKYSPKVSYGDYTPVQTQAIAGGSKSAAAIKGDYVLPMGSIPGAGGKPAGGRGGSKRSTKRGTKRGGRSKTRLTRGKNKGIKRSAKKTNTKTRTKGKKNKKRED